METLSNLTQLNKVPLDMTLEGLAAVQQGRRADDIGLQELMRKQAFETQMDPLRVANQRLVNKGLTLGHEKAGYELASLGRKDRMETELWDQTKAAQLQKLLASEGEDKAKVFAQGIYQQLRSTKPGTPQHRALMGALATTQDWMEKARDQRDKLAVVGAQGANAKELMQMQIDAGRFTKPDRTNILARLRTAKTSLEKAEILEQAYFEAVAAKDPAAAEYAQRALEARQRAAEDARNRGVASPSIDAGAVSGLPTTAPPAANAPIAGASAPAGKQTKSGVKYQIVNE